MKKLILLLLYIFILLSCNKEEEGSSSETTISTQEPAEVQVTKYTLTVTAGEGGSVTAGGAYDEGTDVTITATPSEGYEFVGWEGSEETKADLTLTLNSDISLTAIFQSSLINKIIGKWDFSSETAKNSCTIISIIFATDFSFKLYTQKLVIQGNFSLSQGTINLLVGSNSIGTITSITASGTNLTATFNIDGYCVAVQVAQKNSIYTPDKTYVPDDNFEQALIDLGYDKVLDDYVLTANVSNLTGQLSLYQKNVSDLTGIEDFKRITNLFLVDNNLTSLDLSGIPQLEELHASNNDIVSVDFSKNINLLSIELSRNNNLSNVDLSNNLELLSFGCSSCNISSIDISKNTKLTSLGLGVVGYPDCNGEFCHNSLTSIDLSSNPNIKNISLDGNNISQIDISNLNQLESLSLQYIPMNFIDLTSTTSLKSLNIYGTNISNLDVSRQDELRVLNCVNTNNLSCITVSQLQLDNQVSNGTINGIVPQPFDVRWTKDSDDIFSLNCLSSTDQNANYEVKVNDGSSSFFYGISYNYQGNYLDAGDNINLEFNVGDKILFKVYSPSYPFYIKKTLDVSTHSLRCIIEPGINVDENISNNGTENGEIIWTPTTPGIYYYQSPTWSRRVGLIIVNDENGNKSNIPAGAIGSFRFPSKMTIDKFGNLFVAEKNKIKWVDTYQRIRTVAGQNESGNSVGNGLESTKFNNIRSITVDENGIIYLVDDGGLKKLTPIGTQYWSSFVSTNITYAGQLLYRKGYLYINDRGTIWKKNVDTGEEDIYVSSQTSNQNSMIDSQMVFDSNGTLFYGTSTGKIDKIDSNGIISSFVGNGDGDYEQVDGSGSNIGFGIVGSLAIDSNDNIIFSDYVLLPQWDNDSQDCQIDGYTGKHLIRKITPDGVSTIIAGGEIGYKNGQAINSKFLYPEGIIIDSDNNIYIADKFNQVIRKIDSQNNVSTYAGSFYGEYDTPID